MTIIMAFIPIFFLYKISTHPLIAKLGYQHPNAPKKYSQREYLEKAMYRLSLIKRRDELLKEYIFLEAMDEYKCHDFPTIDISAQLNQQKSGRPRRRFDGQSKQHKQTKKPRKQTKGKTKGKISRPAGHSRTSSDSPPVMGKLHAYMARPSKGVVATKKIQKAKI